MYLLNFTSIHIDDNIYLILYFAKGAEGLNLKMTAAELRAKLAAKKKFDPKSVSVDLRKKYEIVQKL